MRARPYRVRASLHPLQHTPRHHAAYATRDGALKGALRLLSATALYTDVLLEHVAEGRKTVLAYTAAPFAPPKRRALQFSGQ